MEFFAMEKRWGLTKEIFWHAHRLVMFTIDSGEWQITYELHLDVLLVEMRLLRDGILKFKVKRLACVRQGKIQLGLSDAYHVMLKTSLGLTKTP
jgi:hypothetical protein